MICGTTWWPCWCRCSWWTTPIQWVSCTTRGTEWYVSFGCSENLFKAIAGNIGISVIFWNLTWMKHYCSASSKRLTINASPFTTDTSQWMEWLQWMREEMKEAKTCSTSQQNKLTINFTFKHQPHKMVKHTQTIRRETADELFECVWSCCGVGT